MPSVLGDIYGLIYLPGDRPPYRDDPRQKRLIGVEFSQQDRNLGNWLVEEA